MKPASVLVDSNKKNPAIKYCHLVDISDNQTLKFIFHIMSSHKLPNVLDIFSQTSIMVNVCTLHASCLTFILNFIYMILYPHKQYFKVKENTLSDATCIYPNVELFRI